MDRVRRPRARSLQAILIGLTPLVTLYALLGFATLDRAPDFGLKMRLFQVIQVEPGGPAERAGFRVGDRIVAQNGISSHETLRFLKEHGRIRPGQQVRFTVERDGRQETFTVTAEGLDRRDRFRSVARTAVGICFLFIGVLVLRNREDAVATVFYLVSVLFAFNIIEPPATGDVRLQMLIKIGRDAAVLFLPPLFLQFVLLFPHAKKIPRWLFPLRQAGEGRRALTRFPLHAASLLFFLVSLFLTARIYVTGTSDPVVLGLFQFVVAIYLLACFVTGVAAFIHSYAKTRAPEMRRKLRGVLIGTSVAILPMGAYNVLKQFLPESGGVWDPLLILLTIALPISFGHAIIRYHLLDIELILKKSILYTLLTTFLAMAYLVFVDVVSRVLRSLTGSSDIPATLLSLFLIALLFSPARELIQRWVDRTFYREKYEHRRTLHEFSTALTSILDMDTLLRKTVERISTNLHIPRVAVFLREPDGDLVLEAATGTVEQGEPLRIEGGANLAALLGDENPVLPIERGGEGGRIFPFGEGRWPHLEDLDPALLLPLVSGDELVGLISLGRKRSGEHFSHEDRQLLKTLANHAALAIENSKLHHNTIEKERMEQELRLAREIQLGFLPGKPPALDEIEIGAVNAPCEEIGGDYYDFVLTRPRGLGIAIGDAAGSGVPAALLMANLQASFQIDVNLHNSPAESLGKMNAFTYRQTQDSRFVTFFYGVIDLKTGLFRYANAGHNPPLLVTPIGHYRYLDESDLILGVDSATVYREHAVHLSHGDLIVLYTDGVTDELNARDENFGTDRLEQIVVSNRHLPPGELCDRILRNVVAFLGGEPGDDITLVALRLR